MGPTHALSETPGCGMCGAAALVGVYEPEGSAHGRVVHVCDRCGLVQSLPREDRSVERRVRVSHGADWGNLRYGKAFRTAACLSLVEAELDLSLPFDALDVGSNRGAFARALLAAAPRVRLTAVEPDERIADACAGLPRTTLVRGRIEDAVVADGSLDLIHSCHTLEHLRNPAGVLSAHRRALRSTGLLVVDVPNLAAIESPDWVEEFFIDKHLFHFTAATLVALLEAHRFEVVAGPDDGDATNLLVAARPASSTKPVALDGEAARASAAIAGYAETRRRNQVALVTLGAELGAVASSHKVAIWGAGRLFEALVVQGGFDPTALAVLVDSHLHEYVDERHGVRLSPPDVLASIDPDVIVVMSREFADEISLEAQRRAPRAAIRTYPDLIAIASKAQAERRMIA